MPSIELEHFKQGLFLDDALSFLTLPSLGTAEPMTKERRVMVNEKTIRIQKFNEGPGAFQDVYVDAINYLPYHQQYNLYASLGGANDVMSGIFSGCIMTKYRKAIVKGRGKLVKSEGAGNIKSVEGFSNEEKIETDELENDYRFCHVFAFSDNTDLRQYFFPNNKKSKFEVCFKPFHDDLAELTKLKAGLKLPNGLQFISTGVSAKFDGAMGIITSSNAKYRFFIAGVCLAKDPGTRKLLILSDVAQVDNSYQHAG